MDKDRISNILGEIRFCKAKLKQLSLELESLIGIKGQKTPIAELGLPTRINHSLRRTGYLWIEQLLKIEDWNEVTGRRNNFGEKSLDQVRQKLEEWQADAR